VNLQQVILERRFGHHIYSTQVASVSENGTPLVKSRKTKSQFSLLFELIFSEHVVSEAVWMSVLKNFALGAHQELAIWRPQGTKLDDHVSERPVAFLGGQSFLGQLLLTRTDLLDPDLANVPSLVQFAQQDSRLTNDHSGVVESNRVIGCKHSEGFARVVLAVVKENQVGRHGTEGAVGATELVRDLKNNIIN
jgi:hypothetical protein